MKQSRRLSARTALGSVRLATLVLGVVSTVSMFASLNPDPVTGLRLLSAVSGLLIIGALLATYARGALVAWWDGLGLAVLTGLLGIGLQDPLAIASVAIGVVVAQSMYGNWASALLRIACFIPVIPVTVEVSESPLSNGLTWIDQQAWSLVSVLVLFWGLMRSLKSSLEKLATAAEREDFNSSVASHLLGCSDITQVAQVMRVAVADLCRITDDRMLVVSLSTDRAEDGSIVAARVSHVLGRAEVELGLRLPADFLAPVAHAKRLRFPFLPAARAAMAGAGLPKLDWFAQQVETATTRANDIDVVLYGLPVRWWSRLPLIGSGPRTDWMESVRILAMQTSMAEATVRMYAELERRAQYDDLTATANRSVLFAQLDTAFESSRGTDDEVGLLLIDLDDFRYVNDSRGHAAADALLVELARRIGAAVGDRGLPARFGGDEFAVLLPRVSGGEEALLIAEEIRGRLLEPVQLADGAIVLAASIGVAVTQDGVRGRVAAGAEVIGKDLLRCADVALYAAKTAGKARVELYSSRRHGAVARTRKLEQRLPQALLDGEIAVHFQPIVDLNSGRPVGLEALARWQHPDEGVLEASEFVDVADRAGQGAALGAHIIRTAVAAMRDWAHLPGMDRIWLSVNVSARQVSDPAFLDSLRTVLADTGLPPELLVLELPERGLLGGSELREVLSAIAATGVRIALDDFAAEHASLAHLEAIPVRQLKIDRKQLMALDPERAETMAQMIMSISRFLDLETVAESVETDEHAHWARGVGITLAEGYLFAEPMAPELLSAWLERSVHLRRASAGQVDAGLEAV